ncbi:MAG TPA: DnaJ domain-containing protein [Ktedonobacterales bacterium]|nr:DnaJ domain-containing protein [Ktedonobacterales bacterium]
MSDDLDYYALLGVPSDADAETIRLAFRRLARRYHPDVAGEGTLARMQQLTLAYRVLGDPDQRRLYDLQHGIVARPPAPPPAPTPSPARPPSRPYAPERRPPPPPPPPPTRSAPASRAPRRGTVAVQGDMLRRQAALTTPDATPIAGLAFDATGTLLAAGLLDGRVRLWDPARETVTRTLDFGPTSGAGVLQEVRLSAQGRYAAAWGLQLGTRLWRAADGTPLWTAGFSAPSDLMDVTLLEEPAIARLALPDAPPALGDDDPFRWAHEGRGGTSVFSRTLGGPASPSDAIPLRCIEPGAGRAGRGQPGEGVRVQWRQLSADGRQLLTCGLTGVRGEPRRTLNLWDLERRSLLGAPQPHRITVLSLRPESAGFPMAVTADLSHIAVTFGAVGLRLHAVPQRSAPVDVPAGGVPQDAHIALAPGGRLLALARDDRLELWVPGELAPRQTWRLGDAVSALAFAGSLAAPRLAVGLRNGLLEVWGA